MYFLCCLNIISFYRLVGQLASGVVVIASVLICQNYFITHRILWSVLNVSQLLLRHDQFLFCGASLVSCNYLFVYLIAPLVLSTFLLPYLNKPANTSNTFGIALHMLFYLSVFLSPSLPDKIISEETRCWGTMQTFKSVRVCVCGQIRFWFCSKVGFWILNLICSYFWNFCFLWMLFCCCESGF